MTCIVFDTLMNTEPSHLSGEALPWLTAGKRIKIAVKSTKLSNVSLSSASPLVTTGAPGRTLPNQSVCATLYIHSREDEIKVLYSCWKCESFSGGGLSAVCFCRYAAERVIKI